VPTIVAKLSDIQHALDALAKQHRVPGASLGILSGDEFLEFATGVTSTATGVPVTPETLFQIGSNTKVYTASLVMQLVDEGKVDLDEPVRKYVPELQLADKKAAAQITVRMCLTHTSGIQGDYFDEFGRGDDCLEQYIASLGKITQVHPPGELWTYCNTGFCLAGRVIEKVTGKYWHEALRDKLLAPLGLRRTSVLLEEMIAGRYAVGHVIASAGADPVPSQRVMMSRCHAPAGSLTSSTPREVLRFARMHLEEGKAPDGTQVLSAKSVRAMQETQTKLPLASGLGNTMGIGWLMGDWDGERMIRHGGGTIGQLSYLNVLPDRRFGICLLTNAGTGGLLWNDLGRYLFDELAGVKMPETPKPPAEPPALPLRNYTGTYERLGVQTEVTTDKGGLLMTIKQTGPLAGPNAQAQKIHLDAIDAEVFGAKLGGLPMVAGFMNFDKQGHPTYLHFGGRASRRMATKPKARAKGSKSPASKKRAR
jgi:CubicO group peptidase (beta-lactamase class C family)